MSRETARMDGSRVVLKVKSRPTERTAGVVELTNEVREIRLDLSHSRLLEVVGTTRRGQAMRWHLKVTGKEKLTLL